MNNRMKHYAIACALTVCALLAGCSSSTPPTEPGSTYTLTGKIKAATTESVAGITVTIASASAVTDATGAYTFTGLANGTYVVSPAKAGLTFEPLTHSVTVNGANAVAADFVATKARAYELPEMVAINPGTFMMGAIVGQRASPRFRPQHSVTITRGLWVGKYEVTQKQYESVMGNNPSEFKGDNRPVTNILVLDMVAFCNRLSELEGLTKAYVIDGSSITWNRDANGYRLPTSAEWEYCARAGTMDNTYAGVNLGRDPNPVIDAVAWYRTNSIDPSGNRSTRPVGQKQPNAWGLYDALGNVSEACFESSRSYTADPQIDPWSPFRGDSSIVRGANYTETPDLVVVSDAFQYPIEGLVSSVNGLRLFRNR
jgi:formylglycine-generating enzyme required for sulfatase activity